MKGTQPRFKIKHDRTSKLRFLALKTVQGHIKLKDTIQMEGTIRKLMSWKHINGFVVFNFYPLYRSISQLYQ